MPLAMGDSTEPPGDHNALSPAQASFDDSIQNASLAAERIRVQELLRYFQVPSISEQNNEKKVRVSPDSSLTAYAQLSCLKLDCQRSFISLMDDTTQYIIAEGTRTVSLESEDIHNGEGDALYLGVTNCDLLWGVCPNTIKVFTAADDSLNISTTNITADQEHYVISDLSKVEGYADRQYVTSWPHVRFYAEVPIHSPSGYTIGTLCVADDKPREGLGKKEIRELREIANAIMDHLELVECRMQRKRAERMINGLGLFVEGNDRSGRWWTDSKNSALPAAPSGTGKMNSSEQSGIIQSLFQESSPVSETLSQAGKPGQKQDYFGTQRQHEIQDIVEEIPLISQPTLPASGGDPIIGPILDVAAVTPLDVENAIRKALDHEDHHKTKHLMANDKLAVEVFDSPPLSAPTSVHIPQAHPKFSSDLEETLWRAASLLRDIVDLDGVVFLDPRLGIGANNDPGVLKNPRKRKGPDHESNSATPIMSPKRRASSIEWAARPPNILREEPPRSSKVLSQCLRPDTKFSSPDINELLLQRLIKRYPQGVVLKFDPDGNLVGQNKLEYQESPKPRVSHPSILDVTAIQDHVLDITSLYDEPFLAHGLHDTLLGASTVILFPLRKTGSNKLFSFNVAWTKDPRRIFQREDFAYIASFSSLISAELSRLDTIAADRAKADFISSVSHELRSPLHGMLASAELLLDLTKDPTAINIISTIEACGSTLLDTMDNLLTFAKINNFTITQQQKDSKNRLAVSAGVRPGITGAHISSVDLAVLVEEVMNSSIAGHQFRKTIDSQYSRGLHDGSDTNLKYQADTSITVICDIEPHSNWKFESQVGAWKRILMNLLGNSLKYTSTGFIVVRLEQHETEISDLGQTATSVFLSVEDSGQGISDEYLRTKLFKPFQQEDALRPGTGLGLSIVHQLVASIGGRIDVSSKLGSGTKVTVNAVVNHTTAEEDSAQMFSSDFAEIVTGSSVGITRFDSLPGQEEVLEERSGAEFSRDLAVRYAITRTVEHLGLRIIDIRPDDPDDADIIITTERAFRETNYGFKARRKPTIILSEDLTLDYRLISTDKGHIVYLSQPFGPQRIAKAIESCLSYDNSTLHAGTIASLDEQPRTLKTPGTRTHDSNSPLTLLPHEIEDSLPSTPKVLGPRALLVEDNPINLELLVAYMKKLNFEYVTAMDGLQAYETYCGHGGNFDIIFMDIQMPTMDGMTSSHKIRKFEKENSLKSVRIVALTGLASIEAQEEASGIGIDIFLTKPVPLKKLKSILDTYFPRSLPIEEAMIINTP